MLTKDTPGNDTSTGFRYDPEAAAKRRAQERSSSVGARKAEFAAQLGLDPTDYYDQPIEEQAQAPSTSIFGADHLPTKDDPWVETVADNPHPDKNKPTIHAEHLMNFVLSDLSHKGCSPTAMLLAIFYTSFFNPYRGSLHPEFFRARNALGITEYEYDCAIKEIGDANTVLVPVKSQNVVGSGWWLALSEDVEARVQGWLNTPAGKHLRRSYDPSRRTLIKYNIRYSRNTFTSKHAQLASAAFALRVGMKVVGLHPNERSVTYETFKYRSDWLAKNLNITEEEARAAVRELANSNLWDIAEPSPGCYFISVSDTGAQIYDDYYPNVFYTRPEDKKRFGVDETAYERRWRKSMGFNESWMGTASQWKEGDARREWELMPHEFPEADGIAYKDPNKKWYIIYEIICPITGEVIYIGITSRKMWVRLLEHITRPGITYSEFVKGQKEYNPLMAARMKVYQRLGLEPLIRKRRVVQGRKAAMAIEGNTVRKLEAQGVKLMNLEHSEIRPDKKWRELSEGERQRLLNEVYDRKRREARSAAVRAVLDKNSR